MKPDVRRRPNNYNGCRLCWSRIGVIGRAFRSLPLVPEAEQAGRGHKGHERRNVPFNIRSFGLFTGA